MDTALRLVRCFGTHAEVTSDLMKLHGQLQSVIVALLFNVLTGNAANAQAQVERPSASFGTESTAWERILVYVVSSLSTHLVRTAGDTSLQPWKIVLPPDAPQREKLEAKLRTILRARPVLADDTVVYELEIGRLSIVKDTGRVSVRTDFARRCIIGKNQWTGYGNIDHVYVVLHPQGVWSVARSEGISHGDRIGC
jgi:hypothetical protein